MKSVANELALEDQNATLALPVSERVALALRLGEQAIDTYASANSVSRDEARRVLRRNNQIGRRPSAAAAEND
jgi:hypothetical protein